MLGESWEKQVLSWEPIGSQCTRPAWWALPEGTEGQPGPAKGCCWPVFCLGENQKKAAPPRPEPM